MKFCVKCGKDIEKGIFCKECNPKREELKEFSILICGCGKYFSKKRWIRFKDIKSIIKKTLSEKFKREVVAIPEKIDMPYNRADFEVHLKDNTIVKVTLLKNKCNLCGRKGTDYFEGILQLRSKNQENSENAINFLNRQLKIAEKKGIYANKMVKQKQGVDIYITSQRYIQEIARKIHSRFGGIIKINATLFSRNKQTSKNIYRVNAYIELPNLSINDVIKINNKIVRIIKLGKNIVGRNIINKKQVLVKYGKSDFKLLKTYETGVTKTHPKMEALNPLNYQSEIIKNPEIKKINQKIRIVMDNGMYLID